MLVRQCDIDSVLKIFLQLLYLLVFLFNGVELLLLERFQCVELFVVVSLEFENNLSNQFNLCSLALICVKFKGIIKQVVDVWRLESFLYVFKFALEVDDFPMNLLHAYYIVLSEILFGVCVPVVVLLSYFGAKSSLG